MQVLPNLLNFISSFLSVECLPCGIIKWAKRPHVGHMILLVMKTARYELS
jgi:hypothetical protein